MNEISAGFRQAEEWVRAVEGRLDVGFWTLDIETGRLVCSPGLYALVGVNSASLHLDLPFIESMVHPADRLAIESLGDYATDSRQVDRHFRLIRPDAQARCLRSQATRLYDREGVPSRVVCVVSDVTEKHELTSRLDKKRALLLVVAQILDGSLWIADEHGNMLEQFAPNIPGVGVYDEPEKWRDGLHPDDIDRLAEVWRDTVSRRQPYFFAPRRVQPDGSYQRIHVAGLPLSRELSPEFNYGGLSSRNSRLLPAFTPQKTEEPVMTPAQVRACRVLLNWTAETLAQKAGISVSTIRRIEGAQTGQGQGESIRMVTAAFKEAGLTMSQSEDGRFSITYVG